MNYQVIAATGSECRVERLLDDWQCQIIAQKLHSGNNFYPDRSVDYIFVWQVSDWDTNAPTNRWSSLRKGENTCKGNNWCIKEAKTTGASKKQQQQCLCWRKIMHSSYECAQAQHKSGKYRSHSWHFAKRRNFVCFCFSLFTRLPLSIFRDVQHDRLLPLTRVQSHQEFHPADQMAVVSRGLKIFHCRFIIFYLCYRCFGHHFTLIFHNFTSFISEPGNRVRS